MTESNSAGSRDAWEKLLSSAISQPIDPAPIVLSDLNFARGRALVTRWRRESAERLHFRKSIPRNAFLAGCVELTDGEPREHLIVGFGVRRGNSAFVSHVVRGFGGTGSVSFPSELQQEIAQYVRKGHRNEALVFHNHPSNLINVVIDNEPWASPQDRAIAIRHLCDPLSLMKAISDGGRTRFYLGENGYVREFIGPDVFALLRAK